MKLLVVEDEHRIANTIRKGLEQERYIVDVAYTGDEGLDLALGEQYDAIVLDRMLPGVDGLSICRELRKQQNHTPILLLTAKSQVHDTVEGLDAGADDYLAKPFSFEELLARLRALTRRPKETAQSELRVGPLLLNPHTFTVTRSGTLIALSSKEFSLLEFLMRHEGTVMSKDQIMNQVWDYNADILPNTVEVYIRNLRKKVDVPFPKEPPLIQTVRGFGYRIRQ